MEIRKSKKSDVLQIVEIINQAKAYLKENGIPQWQNGYPDACDVLDDIQKGGAYCACENGEVIGYSYISSLAEPNYTVIDGAWFNDDTYIVIHRICVDSSMKGKNVASLFIEKAKEIGREKGIFNIRIDTHEKNASMQRMVEKNVFKKTGIIYVKDGSPRYAYQLIVCK